MTMEYTHLAVIFSGPAQLDAVALHISQTGVISLGFDTSITQCLGYFITFRSVTVTQTHLPTYVQHMSTYIWWHSIIVTVQLSQKNISLQHFQRYRPHVVACILDSLVKYKRKNICMKKKQKHETDLDRQ